MNRHILGLSVFLVIVKTTFLLYWGFWAPKPFVNFAENEIYTQNAPVNKTNCFPTINISSTITYAEFDAKSKTLRMIVRTNDQAALIADKNKMFVYLTFVKDEHLHAIGSAETVITEQVYQNGYTELKLKTTLDLLDKYDLRNATLYVMAVGDTETIASDVDLGGFKTEPVPVLFSH